METVDENILVQYIESTLSKDEMSAVGSWLAASPENQRTLEQVYYTLQVAQRVKVMDSVDTGKALQRFKSTVKKKNKQSQPRRFLLWTERVAAILLIPVLILSTFLFLQKEKKAVRMVEVRTSPGVVSSFNLPDGTKVWLNANSTLAYPSEFTNDNRTVTLEGQGYFEVTKNPHKPFIVKTENEYAVKVLGTTFNVSAYKDEETIETTLLEGSVQLDITYNGKMISRRMKPNEKAEYKKTTNQLAVKAVNTDYDTAWKNGEIIFRNHPMDQVLKVLSRHYHVRFEVKEPEVLASIITARFKNEQLPQVLEYLNLASRIKYKINKPVVNSDNSTEMPIIEISK